MGTGPTCLCWFRSLLERLERIPGVTSASTAAFGTLGAADGGVSGLQVQGYTPRDPDDGRSRADWVGPNYFRTAGIPLRAGRDFSAADVAATAGVAIVNETMARHFFGVQTAIGRRFVWNRKEYEIVGLAEDAKHGSLRAPAPRMIYFAGLQGGPMGSIEVRTSGDSGTAAAAVRAAIRETDPRLAVGEVAPLSDRIDRVLARERLVARLSGFFGLLTLALVSIGVYGTLSYRVSTRIKEIGVRLALGSSRPAVIWSVLRELTGPAALGLALGLAGVFAAGPLAASLLFGVDPADPATLAAAAGAMVIVAFAAGLLPAIRASRLDPATVLEAEM